jgi:hypothetical protein
MDPLHLVGYASGADATGYPRAVTPTTIQSQFGRHPGAKPAGGTCVDLELGKLCAEVLIAGSRGSSSVRKNIVRERL